MDKIIKTWFESNTFHHSRFSDIGRLVELKRSKGIKISLGFPTLNEEETIEHEISVIKTALIDKYPLLDEIAVIDSGSTDKTCEIAAQAGADVYRSTEILKKYGSYPGKGENLWKSLYVLSGDIIAWIDADIKNIHPKFVYGIIGPLLENEDIGYVKAFYQRPIKVGNRMKPVGGGRITEILARPLLTSFYPEVSLFLQPLSGEYAGRRNILENIPFRVGYGVEIGHLLDIFEKYGMSVFAQVDLDKRVHRNQSLPALSKMSFAILQTVLAKLKETGRIQLEKEVYQELNLIKVKQYVYMVKKEKSRFYERPPMSSIKEYREKRGTL